MNSLHPVVSGSLIQLQRVVAFFTAALMLSTWPLWSSASSGLVQIPWFSVLCSVPGWVDIIALAAVVVGLVTMLWGLRTPHQQRLSLACFLSGLMILVLLDQHRLQPWVCMDLLFAGLFLISPNLKGINCWKLIVASIYLWSAVSKFDASFMTSHGQLLLNGMLNPLGVPLDFWSPRSKWLLVATFPTGEFIVGLLLLSRRARRYGLPLSILMHLLLLWTLGVGLRHEWGVLIWNMYFIVQNLVLFWPDCKRTVVEPESEQEKSTRHSPLAIGFTAIAVFYPGLEVIGDCDHWPAWAVYSSRPEQVDILIDEEAANQLPEDLRKLLGTPAPLDDRIPLSLDAWSFTRSYCPVYPQERYRIALALALLENSLPDEALTVEIRSTPDRWSGKRAVMELKGIHELKTKAGQYWFNTRPRN
ncbi:hypothetical protein SH661x_004693 [Planctomicrobium sp. SH661]|uniref:hypothetical protein n=1 Tax=Planctomicrobium sp. SH661 TaxID=3448124 RepID=UPI003F5BA0E5